MDFAPALPGVPAARPTSAVKSCPLRTHTGAGPGCALEGTAPGGRSCCFSQNDIIYAGTG